MPTDVPAILSKSLEEKRIEVAIVCLEGSGTSVVTDPSIMKEIGPRIIGSESTEPDKQIIDIVGEDNVLDPETAKVDQIEGVCVAYDNGMHRVAVTTHSDKDAQMMRDMFGSDLCIIGILQESTDRARELMDIILVGNVLEIITDFGKEISG
ncbi:DUF2099 family protein [Methanomassiliicoccales archaeon LGM-RCC1]|nr:DUF2099 family protein [Methanomassiliicoccales archaeon LGM-RCC1]